MTRDDVHHGVTVGTLQLRTPLFGSYNVANVLGAASLHLACGTPVTAVVNGVARLQRVPGRLERVAHPTGRGCWWTTRTPTMPWRVRWMRSAPTWEPTGGCSWCSAVAVTVMPASGPRMGEAAALRADVVVVTSDNPRSEQPEAIAQAIMEGVHRVGIPTLDSTLRGTGVHVELDRAQAIALAVRAAGAGDVVLLAGKGHETEQIFKDRKIAFDDRKVALEAMKGVAS